MADGIIAPGFEPAALELLKAKKGGKFIVLEAKPDYEAPAGEFREVYGVGFYQDRNTVAFGKDNLKVGGAVCAACGRGYVPALLPRLARWLGSMGTHGLRDAGWCQRGQECSVALVADLKPDV